jgi:hypothetical protein
MGEQLPVLSEPCPQPLGIVGRQFDDVFPIRMFPIRMFPIRHYTKCRCAG